MKTAHDQITIAFTPHEAEHLLAEIVSVIRHYPRYSLNANPELTELKTKLQTALAER